MKIGIVVYQGCVFSGMLAFMELLGVANKRSGKKYFDVQWVSTSLQSTQILMGEKNLSVTVTPTLSLLDDSLDVILLAGFWSNAEKQLDMMLKTHQSLTIALKKISTNKPIWAYCTGVCLLAKTGRLNNQTATSTWWLAEYLQRKHPQVKWNFSQTCDFKAHNVTASGVNGYLPIAQQLITQYCGKEIMRDLVDLLILPKPEKKLQPFQQLKLIKMEDKLLRELFVWVEATVASQLSIDSLAKAHNYTSRTICRKVKQESGLSCAKFMKLIKLNQASDYLIYSSLSINNISDLLGYTDDTTFRRSFKQISNYSPAKYRQMFQRA